MKAAFLAVIVAAFALGSTVSTVYAAPVLVFDNGTYVDTSNNPEAESDTLQAALIQTGNPVTTFTSTTAAGIAAALAGQTVLVIPEQENAALADDLDEDARNVIRNFVSNGGGLIISADYRDFLNTLFNYSLLFSLANDSQLRPAAAVGTAFEGGPATLPALEVTLGFSLASLPPGARSIYDDGALSTVTLFNFGAGQIVQLGYDFNDAAPLGTQDGGWLEVLDRAVAQVSGDQSNPPGPNPVPEPGSIALAIAGLGAYAGACRRRRA